MGNLKEDFKKVKAFVFDVDGVFSGHILLNKYGEQIHPLNMKDGYAIQLIAKKKYPIAIITGGRSEIVRGRFERLGVKEIFISVENKLTVLDDFLERYNINAEDVLYMGDDIPDYLCMKKCGMPVCPADAAIDIKEISRYVSDIKSGEGCVRDVIEQVLRVKGEWLNADAFTW